MELLVILFALMVSPGMPQIVAHRGASFDAPENTLAAFNLAWKQGADAIEGDFQLTKDGHIVCIHDKDTGRVAKEKLIVAESTFTELRHLDVGAWKGRRWAGERIPTLEEVLKTVPRGKRLLLEIKCGPEIVPVLQKTLRKTKTDPDKIVIICFDAEVVAAAKKVLPMKAFWLTSFRKHRRTARWSPTIATILRRLKSIRADGLDCNAHECVDMKFAAWLRKAGFEFHVWTVNDVSVAKRFQSLGVQSLTTDRPGWLRDRLRGAE